MVRVKEVLKYVDEIEGTRGQIEIGEETEERFKSTFKGKTVVAAILNNRFRSNIKEANVNKIMNFLAKKDIKIESIRGEGFGKAEVTFFDVVQANKWLDVNKGQEDPMVKFIIPSRVKRVKGIITDWDSDMPLLDELVTAIDNFRHIVQLERMKLERINILTRESAHRVRVTHI